MPQIDAADDRSSFQSGSERSKGISVSGISYDCTAPSRIDGAVNP
jgi:hypothetical protein